MDINNIEDARNYILAITRKLKIFGSGQVEALEAIAEELQKEELNMKQLSMKAGPFDTEEAVKICNLRKIPMEDPYYSGGYTYIFDAYVANRWLAYGYPCGDWSAKVGEHSGPFSVRVGKWELDAIFNS